MPKGADYTNTFLDELALLICVGNLLPRVRLLSSRDISEAFNSYFATTGEKLACKIPGSEVYPLTNLEPTDSSFTFHKITSKEDRTLSGKTDAKKQPVSTDFYPSFLIN